MELTIILSILFLAALAWAAWLYIKEVGKQRLLHTALSPKNIVILERSVPLYMRLPMEMRAMLQGCINLFLKEKIFVGCDGLEITDEVRIVIAANACMLILNRDKKYFPGFETILVYPDTYLAREISYDGLVERHDVSTRAGESWFRGPVVLSLADVLRGGGNESDGHNVVLHEFAHKLDEENGVMDGLPVLRRSEDYKEWAEVLTREYSEFLDRVNRHKNTVIDEYGAISASEFFAVASESFFEKSVQMKKKLPELYQQLKTFYGLDPAQW